MIKADALHLGAFARHTFTLFFGLFPPATVSQQRSAEHEGKRNPNEIQ